jgi:hypothetical protein
MGKGFSPRVAGDDGVLGGRKSSGKILDGSSLALVFGWRRIKDGGSLKLVVVVVWPEVDGRWSASVNYSRRKRRRGMEHSPAV